MSGPYLFLCKALNVHKVRDHRQGDGDCFQKKKWAEEKYSREENKGRGLFSRKNGRGLFFEKKGARTFD